ncbi:MAG: hypothetical protein JNM57_01600 [Cyclobacteriaceae bacterium]|nr:hypothetical protein [Cyclobacteriaceae bacterium]
MRASVLTVLWLLSLTSYAQFVAKLELKESIAGICNDKEVYAMFPTMKGQEEAVCPVSKTVILERLNSEVQFLMDNPRYDDKGMIGIIINCKGEVVQCKMDNKTKSPELDKQIEAVFNTLGEWKPGKLNRKEVDTSRLFSFKIKNGKIVFE